MRKKILWIFMIGCLITGGCKHNENAKLEEALALSGENRKELEKVLKHYSQSPTDSLKLKSAIFLIENMPGHYTFEGQYIREYKAKIDTIKGLSLPIKKILYAVPYGYPDLRKQLIKTEDIKSISANFLISHVDAIFQQKDSCPWLEDLDFEIFREYLLPYCMDHEILEEVQYPESRHSPDVDYAIKYYDDCQNSINKIVNIIKQDMYNKLKYIIQDTTIQFYYFNNNALNKVNLITHRLLGIPTAIDFIPIDDNSVSDRQWICPIDPRSRKNNLSQLGSYIGKIYRRTFSHNPIPKATENEYIPFFFRDPFNKDVTDEYLVTANIELEIPQSIDQHYAYLAIFNDQKWIPVSYCLINGKKCKFTNLGKNSLYLPIYYRQDTMIPFSPPFILNNMEKIIPLIIRRDSTQNIRLKRTQPNNSEKKFYNNHFQDWQFECSNDRDFTSIDSVYKINEHPYYEYKTIYPDTTKAKRYWRFQTNSTYCKLAEVEFINNQGEKIHGKIMGNDTAYLSSLWDNNPSTDKIIKEWFSIDFGNPICISQIRFLTQNDGNNICPGNEYELFYFQTDGWHSVGIKKAMGDFIEFSGIPTNTIYRLKNTTRKENGAIFTWEDEEPRFWCNIK